VGFDAALAESGVDAEQVHANASLLESHQEVVCAIARGEADVGLASAAWAQHLGLTFRALFSEAYGLTLRAASMGDPRVVRVCEAAQGRLFRRRLGGVAGYGTRKTGNIVYSSA
jgi:molybdate-binding protein